MEKQNGGKGKWIALGCLIPVVLVVLAIGGVILFGWLFVKDRLVTDPGAVEREARKVMVYKFPKGSQGIMKLGLFGVDVFVVQSRAQPPEASLVLAHIPSSVASKAEADIRDAIQQRMNRQLKVKRTRTEQRVLCGVSVPVRIEQGQTDGPGGAPTPVTSVDTLVKHDGKLRMVLVMGMGSHSERSAEAVFGSLSCPK